MSKKENSVFHISVKEHVDRMEGLAARIKGIYFLFGTDTWGTYYALKKAHEHFGMEFKPPKCKLGRYEMTNHGLVYEVHGKFFRLDSDRQADFENPIDGEVFTTRAVSSFDF